MSIRRAYAYHKPSEASLKKITDLRLAFSALHDKIAVLAPDSREKSVAVTYLETAAMWAIKAVVANDSESEAIV